VSPATWGHAVENVGAAPVCRQFVRPTHLKRLHTDGTALSRARQAVVRRRFRDWRAEAGVDHRWDGNTRGKQEPVRQGVSAVNVTKRKHVRCADE
jgi:hypothetical protein